MNRAMLRYAPGFLVPMFTSMAGIWVFTRILPPQEYGLYALAVSVAQLGQALLFSWAVLSTKRFYELSSRSGTLATLTVTIYAGLLLGTVILIGLCAAAVWLGQLSAGLRALLPLIAATTIAKQLSASAKTFELAGLSGRRYVAMEATESLLALGVGATLCWFLRLGAAGTLYGLAAGASAVVLMDVPQLCRRVRGGSLDLRLQGQLFAFAWPVAIAFFLEYLTASSDRFLVDYYLGTDAVGVYAVSYSLAERAISSAFLALSVGAYPLIVRAHEQGGSDAASQQALANIRLMLALSIPALGGFVIAAPRIAAVMVGPDYRSEAVMIMAPIGIAVFLFNLRAHYFSNALDLAKKTQLSLLASAPGVVVNLGLNILLLPRIGLMGAVWATMAAYALELAISIAQSIRIYPFPFPLRDAGKTVVATLLMCGALAACPYPVNARGLAYTIFTGVFLYASLALLLDVGQLRQIVFGRLAQYRWRRPA